MRVFIAGGAGYVGSRLVPFLLDRVHEVMVADLLWFGNALPSSVPVLQKDIFSLTEADLRGFDAVVFLAGLSNDPMAEYSPAMNFISNGAAPTYLAYIAKRAGVRRYVYAGSCSVYGHIDSTTLATEETEPRSVYPYGISKLKGEFGVLRMHDHDFSVICLRKGTVGGWGPRMRFDLLLNTMFMHASKTGKLTVNNPDIWRPILAMSDAIHAHERALVAPSSVQGIFNIHTENITVGEAARRVCEYFKTRRGQAVDVFTKHIPDARNYRVSHDRAVRELAFHPRGSVETILADLDANIGKDFNYDDDRFYNIKMFEKLLVDKTRVGIL